MANYLAMQLDRAGLADMSCIAGVGGGIEALVRTARSGRRIAALVPGPTQVGDADAK